MVEKKTKTILKCTCELPGCRGSWESQGEDIPKRCRWCSSPRWNRTDLRYKHMLTANGKTMTIPQWADEIGVAESTIRARINYGWTHEEALGFAKHEIKRERIA